MSEFNTKEFKRQVEKAKTCRELIQVLKVSVSIVDIIVLPEKRGGIPQSLGWGCAARNLKPLPYYFKTKICDFFNPDFRPERKIDTSLQNYKTSTRLYYMTAANQS